MSKAYTVQRVRYLNSCDIPYYRFFCSNCQYDMTDYPNSPNGLSNFIVTYRRRPEGIIAHCPSCRCVIDRIKTYEDNIEKYFEEYEKNADKLPTR